MLMTPINFRAPSREKARNTEKPEPSSRRIHKVHSLMSGECLELMRGSNVESDRLPKYYFFVWVLNVDKSREWNESPFDGFSQSFQWIGWRWTMISLVSLDSTRMWSSNNWKIIKFRSYQEKALHELETKLLLSLMRKWIKCNEANVDNFVGALSCVQ